MIQSLLNGILQLIFIGWSVFSFLAYTFFEFCLARCCPCFSTNRLSILQKVSKKSDDGPKTRGKIGSGIAGSGAAWTLSQDNFDVHVFESAPTAGGNAKTFLWPDGKRTGLSVLAWPEEYFNNYQALLSKLNVSHSDVHLGFHIRNSEGENFIQGNMPSSQLFLKHRSSIRGWEWMLSFVIYTNRLFNCFPKRKSLYRMNMLNPLNLIPLRWLSILFGVKRECWDEIIVPMYASTFLTIRIDTVPSIILPIISDIIPLQEPAVLRSWNTDSSNVFNKLLKDSHVYVNETVVSVEQDSKTSLWSINSKYHDFDRVIFASNAKNVRESGVLPNWLRLLFHNITYTMESDPSMICGYIHSDDGIFPFPRKKDIARNTGSSTSNRETKGNSGSNELLRNDDGGTSLVTTRESLCTNFANFIQSNRNQNTGKLMYTNTFILNSWIPSLEGDRSLPRLVTYGIPENSEHDSLMKSNFLDKVYNHWNHPDLSPLVLGVQYLLRYVQGRNGVYFCGSLATPGNGHDLSFCSGMAVAHSIGAKYPFKNQEKCLDDFNLLRKLMGL
jgi:hypothetical protein